MNKSYYNNREKVLARLKEKYYDETSGLKKHSQEYYDQNKEKILKQSANKNRNLTYQERENRRLYNNEYYNNKRKLFPISKDEKKRRKNYNRNYYHNVVKHINLNPGVPVKINTDKYIVEF